MNNQALSFQKNQEILLNWASKNKTPDFGSVRCNYPVTMQNIQRALFYQVGDFCELFKTYTTDEVKFLLDEVQKGSCLICIAVHFPNTQIQIPHLRSLSPIEVSNMRKQPLSKTLFIFDQEGGIAVVDEASLLISKFEADGLLAKRASLIHEDNKKNQQMEEKNKKIPSYEESVLIKRFEMSLIENIESINPAYRGKIHNKTQLPHAFVLIVMASMLELGYAPKAVTWGSIETFIRKHVVSSQYIKEHSGYDSLTNDYLRVANRPVSVESLKSRVSDYKRNVFKIL